MRDEPLMVCEGGPLDARWYTQADWNTRWKSAQHMRDKGQGVRPALMYRPTRAVRPHPTISGAHGVIAEWQPGSGEQ